MSSKIGSSLALIGTFRRICCERIGVSLLWSPSVGSALFDRNWTMRTDLGPPLIQEFGSPFTGTRVRPVPSCGAALRTGPRFSPTSRVTVRKYQCNSCTFGETWVSCTTCKIPTLSVLPTPDFSPGICAPNLTLPFGTAVDGALASCTYFTFANVPELNRQESDRLP